MEQDWRVWKYPLEMKDMQVVKMPKELSPLCVKAQGGILTLWVLVNAKAPETEYQIAVLETGFPANHIVGFRYVDTAMERQFVWHVFMIDKIIYPYEVHPDNRQ